MAIFQPVSRAASAADEAIALAKGLTGKEAGAGARAGAAAAEAAVPRGMQFLSPKTLEEVESLKQMLQHPTAINDPAGAAVIWDKIYKLVNNDLKLKTGFNQFAPMGADVGKITYKMPDGSVRVLGVAEKPPLGAERLSLTPQEVREIMPPRPVPQAEAAPRPANAYNETRPTGWESTANVPPRQGPSAGASSAAPGGGPAGAAAAPPPPPPPPPRATPWGGTPEPARSSVPSVGPSAAAEPDALIKYGVLAPAGAATAAGIGAGIYGGYDPEGYQRALQTAKSVYGIDPEYKQSSMSGDEMANPPATLGYGYSGSTVSPDESDFAATGAAQYHMRGPLADRINPDMERVYQRQGPMADRAAPTIQRALTASRAAAPTVASGTGQTASPEAASPSLLAQIIRGRFGEAAKEDPNKLTAYQLARDEQDRTRQGSMASGGSVEPKPPKDAALHKALEIIHHLIRRG